MNRLAVFMLGVLTTGGTWAQSLPPAPQLIVGITIDQLRTDYIECFSPLFGEKGFKRLWKEGRVYTNAEYDFKGVDRSSAVATVHTGTTPSMHGIIGNRWMDISTLRITESTYNKAYMGYFTEQTAAPTMLLTSTIGDELKIATQGKGLVYSIAPECDAAVLSAGHAANAAVWLNTATGKWCGSTFYGEFPWWVSQYNDRVAFESRVTGLSWNPVYPYTMYTFLPDWRTMAFKHRLDEDKINKYARYLTSPYVNDEITALATEALNKGSMGADDITDLLALTYYAGTYTHKTVQECAMELQDIYVRLDTALANLLEAIDKKIGLKNTLIFIVSTGYTDSESADSGTYKIPTGEFYLNRCAALLNMYLMASYGEGQYVETYFDNQIYLNQQFIEQKNLSLVEVEQKAAEFLVQFSGVNEVYTTNQLLLGAWTPTVYKIRNAFHRKRSGNLLIDVLPGWNVVDENHRQSKVIRNSYIPTPLIFIGYQVKPTLIHTPLDISHIAPTVARLARIRAPNACNSMAIDEF